jgi:hypothetical protein
MLVSIIVGLAFIELLNAARMDKDLKGLNHEGTLVAAFVTHTKIFLLSDGRVIRKRDGTIYDNWSKVHMLNKRVGMLTCGLYPPTLREDIIRKCQDRKLSSLTDVTKIASLVLQEIWRQVTANPKNQDNIRDARIFVFVAGFDETMHPHLYYLDNLSEPRFQVQEKPLFVSGNELEIGVMSTDNQAEDPSGLLTRYLAPHLRTNKVNLRSIIYSAFNYTKNELSKKNPQIGGETFFAEIGFREGFKDISNEAKNSKIAKP